MRPLIPLAIALLTAGVLAAGGCAATEQPIEDLFVAAQRGDSLATERLIAQGGNPNAPDDEGRTPLHIAVGASVTVCY
jgi:hypothetical protein